MLTVKVTGNTMRTKKKLHCCNGFYYVNINESAINRILYFDLTQIYNTHQIIYNISVPILFLLNIE